MTDHPCLRPSILGLLVVLALGPRAAAEPLDNDTCLACHGDPSADKPIAPAAFQSSIHGALQCTACHTAVTTVPHDTPLAPVSCSQCHEVEADIYRQSDHGKALHGGQAHAASCRDCHGNPHQMRDSRDPTSPVFRANIPATCAQCHGKTKDMARFQLSQAAPIASYEDSVHGLALARGVAMAAVCTDCHGSHDLQKATNPASKLYWQAIPATCGKCHENIRQTFQRSVHGSAVVAGKRDAPVCTDCHGEHTIASVKDEASSVFPSRIPETCGQCHAAERITTKYRLPGHVLETYMDSFHGLALQMGSVTAANCASCHGAHDILPPTDQRSSIHPQNLAQTCGKCHAGVSAQVAKGQIHSGTRPGLEHRVAGLVRQLYLWLIGLTIGGMVLHNLLDFLRKLRAHYAQRRSRGPLRMTRNERAQHALLILAFVVLAYTGFALKFPQAWWASPFAGHSGGRSIGHRLAAALFVTLGAYHIWFVLCTPRGRHELRELAPRRHDLIQPFQMSAYNLGLRSIRPALARYSYIEKAEYWALVWGSMVMAVTGALLTWEGWTLRVFPKWVVDVVTAIHYYEAILACLAIIVWHFYFVMFDPAVYPMKWTWVTGHGGDAEPGDGDRPAASS